MTRDIDRGRLGDRGRRRGGEQEDDARRDPSGGSRGVVGGCGHRVVGDWQGGMEGVQTLCSREAATVRSRTSAVCEPLVSSRLRVRLQFPDLRTEGEGGCIAAR
jgi:hypothetical protein